MGERKIAEETRKLITTVKTELDKELEQLIHCGNDFVHVHYATKALHNLLHKSRTVQKVIDLNILR